MTTEVEKLLERSRAAKAGARTRNSQRKREEAKQAAREYLARQRSLYADDKFARQRRRGYPIEFVER